MLHFPTDIKFLSNLKQLIVATAQTLKCFQCKFSIGIQVHSAQERK